MIDPDGIDRLKTYVETVRFAHILDTYARKTRRMLHAGLAAQSNLFLSQTCQSGNVTPGAMRLIRCTAKTAGRTAAMPHVILM